MTVHTISPTQSGMKGTKRLHYLDHLRVALTVLVIAHHASQAYAPLSGAWPVSNLTKSAILDPFQAVNGAFFMGLFFLISGYFVPGAYDRKGAGAFLKGRFIRLALPALFFAVFVFGPMEYLGMPIRPSFGEFISHLYRSGYQNLYVHLWFLLHLLLYSAGYALWRLITKRFSLRARSDGKLPWHAILLVFTIIFILLAWVVSFRYTLNEWIPLLGLVPAEMYHLPQYVNMFVLGILAYRFKALEQLPTAAGMLWFGVGLIVAVWFYVDFPSAESFMRSQSISGVNTGSLVWATWQGLVCVGLGVGLLVLFREWINKKAGRLMAAITRAQYGAYIIHVLVVIAVQAGIASLTLPPFVKFILATLVGATLSFGISHLVLKIPGLKRVI